MESPRTTHPSDSALAEQVDRAAATLARGGVVSLPTDTLYGLAASAMDEGAIRRVFAIKGRLPGAAIPILLADASEIPRYAIEVSELAWRLSELFHPGPLTLVLRSAGTIPKRVSGGLDTIALRVPDHWVPRAVARALGAPITGTSANRSGAPGLSTAEAVRAHLGPDVDMVVDGGECPVGIASTVVDLSRTPPVVLREGAVSRQQLEEASGTAFSDEA